jgi:hypothetical protein
MRTILPIALVLTVGAACSQRVTTEEEFARQERERPLVSAESVRRPPLVAGDESAAPVEAPDDAAQTIRGTIDAPAGATGGVLFLFVRPAGATGGPPLAVQRVPSPTFPREFVIGPQDAMVAGGPFPDRITIEARLDQDGNAMTEGPDDLSARSETAPGSTGVALTLAPTT